MHKAKELTDTQRVKLQDEHLTATCSMDKNRYMYIQGYAQQGLRGTNHVCTL